MKIPISDNLIKHYLRNVYFINGHSYAGKIHHGQNAIREI